MNQLWREIYEEVARLPEADQQLLAERWQRDLQQRSSNAKPVTVPTSVVMEQSANPQQEEGRWAQVAKKMREENLLKGHSEQANALFRQFRDHFIF